MICAISSGFIGRRQRDRFKFGAVERRSLGCVKFNFLVACIQGDARLWLAVSRMSGGSLSVC